MQELGIGSVWGSNILDPLSNFVVNTTLQIYYKEVQIFKRIKYAFVTD